MCTCGKRSRNRDCFCFVQSFTAFAKAAPGASTAAVATPSVGGQVVGQILVAGSRNVGGKAVVQSCAGNTQNARGEVGVVAEQVDLLRKISVFSNTIQV